MPHLHIMRTSIPFIFSVICFIALTANAASDVAPNMPLENGSDRYVGWCGVSEVTITGATKIIGEFKNTVPKGKTHQLAIAFDEVDGSSLGGASCVETKKGFRLIVWNNCSQSTCNEKFESKVINVDNPIYGFE